MSVTVQGHDGLLPVFSSLSVPVHISFPLLAALFTVFSCYRLLNGGMAGQAVL